MSMRYFTLSAVCMLIFCMLLALSGTTDFPAVHDEILSQTGAVAPIPAAKQPTADQAIASVVPRSQGTGLAAAEVDATGTVRGTTRNRPLLLLGIALVAGWTLLSFRLFSRAQK